MKLITSKKAMLNGTLILITSQAVSNLSFNNSLIIIPGIINTYIPVITQPNGENMKGKVKKSATEYNKEEIVSKINIRVLIRWSLNQYHYR